MILCRSYRSAATPPGMENRKDGNCSAKMVTPIRNAELVIEYTTQTTAVRCIQVPNCDTDLPVKYKEYFRLRNALNMSNLLNLFKLNVVLTKILKMSN